MIKRFIFEEKGQAAVEYIILVSLLALFFVKFIDFLGNSFREGLVGLKNLIETFLETGEGFK